MMTACWDGNVAPHCCVCVDDVGCNLFVRIVIGIDRIRLIRESICDGPVARFGIAVGTFCPLPLLQSLDALDVRGIFPLKFILMYSFDDDIDDEDDCILLLLLVALAVVNLPHDISM